MTRKDRWCNRWKGLSALLAGIYLACLSIGCGASPDLALYNRMEKAQELFNKASTTDDFLHAAAIYREILDTGFVNGALLYNLGNAYMQADQRGYAIAAFRQALRYRPRDPYLEANLKYALGGSSRTQERRNLLEHLLFWQNWLSYPEKYDYTLAAAGFTLLLAMAALFLRNKVIWKRLAWGALAVTLLLALSAGYDAYRYEYIKHGVITHSDVVARKGNSESFEPAFMDSLQEGTEFRVLETSDGWLLIKLDGANEGCWIRDKDAALY